MSRYDKYDPVSGGFRAPLAANFGYTSGKPDYAHTDLNRVKVVCLNTSGQVVIGFTNTTDRPVGVLVLTTPKAAGEIVDVMTAGEIVEFLLDNGSAAAAGTHYTGNEDGTYGTTAPSANVPIIGFTVEATRLVVRFGKTAILGT